MLVNDYYSEERHGPHEFFELGDFVLESGITLPGAKLAYKTHGTLSEARDNVILFPHMWSGTPKAMEIFIGEDRPLDPRKYFIILPGQFANGFSSSPSNTGTVKLMPAITERCCCSSALRFTRQPRHP
jgi:homoserine O-acetyltransferase/O-succinyltransferase